MLASISNALGLAFSMGGTAVPLEGANAAAEAMAAAASAAVVHGIRLELLDL
jgi:hypothetical protein